jgi:hypothetical protein
MSPHFSPPRLFGSQLLIGDNNRHGAQGQMDGASQGTLENEFGTKNEEECIKAILEKGNLQDTEVGSPSPSTRILECISSTYNVY